MPGYYGSDNASTQRVDYVINTLEIQSQNLSILGRYLQPEWRKGKRAFKVYIRVNWVALPLFNAKICFPIHNSRGSSYHWDIKIPHLT
jgi:hypothetical protein